MRVMAESVHVNAKGIRLLFHLVDYRFHVALSGYSFGINVKSLKRVHLPKSKVMWKSQSNHCILDSDSSIKLFPELQNRCWRLKLPWTLSIHGMRTFTIWFIVMRILVTLNTCSNRPVCYIFSYAHHKTIQ